MLNNPNIGHFYFILISFNCLGSELLLHAWSNISGQVAARRSNRLYRLFHHIITYIHYILYNIYDAHIPIADDLAIFMYGSPYFCLNVDSISFNLSRAIKQNDANSSIGLEC